MTDFKFMLCLEVEIQGKNTVNFPKCIIYYKRYMLEVLIQMKDMERNRHHWWSDLYCTFDLYWSI